MRANEHQPYSEQEEAAILNALRPVDNSFSSIEMVEIAIGVLARDLGRINYAEIESLCRKHNLQTSFLAVPWTAEMQDASPNIIVVDPYDVLEKRPYLALACKTPVDLLYYANMYGVNYDPRMNLAHLAQAGVRMPRFGTKTELRPEHNN